MESSGNWTEVIRNRSFFFKNQGELYKLSGRNLVDGSPPAASFSSNGLVNQKCDWWEVCHVEGWKIEKFKNIFGIFWLFVDHVWYFLTPEYESSYPGDQFWYKKNFKRPIFGLQQQFHFFLKIPKILHLKVTLHKLQSGVNNGVVCFRRADKFDSRESV